MIKEVPAAKVIMRRFLIWLEQNRRGLVIAGLAIVGLFIVWQCFSGSLPNLPMYDFVEYWAAGRLNARGENPYDIDRMHQLEQEAGRESDTVMMWNPPWTLTIAMPFGLLEARPAHLLWLVLQFAVLLFSADALWRFYGGSKEARAWAWVLGFTFAPSIIALTAGQITPLLLLGAVAFLWLQRSQWEVWAGAAAVLLAIKPHLTYLFWIALFLWAWRQRRWRVLAGTLAAWLAATAIPWWFNPEVLGQYVHTLLHRPPAQYRSPTLGAMIRFLVGEQHFRLQFLALIPGLLWFSWYWRRRRDDWDWSESLPALLLASLLTAPYGAWPFDLILLSPLVFQTAAALQRQKHIPSSFAAAAAYLAINAVASLLLIRNVEYFWFFWIAPAMTAVYLLGPERKIPAWK